VACNFEYEFSEQLQEAIKNNWLCNLLGMAGCWFPMDLLQEKHIKQLKKMSQRSDASFGGTFFRDLISYNIRAFLNAIKSMKSRQASDPWACFSVVGVVGAVGELTAVVSTGSC
jgi:hypothetical protein